MLAVCVSSTDAVLATCADVMLITLGATSTSVVATTAEIEYAGRLATRASAWAETYLGRPLTLQVYSESLPSYGGRTLILSRTPLVRVLRFFDSTATSEATAICSSEFRVRDAEAGLLDRDAGFRWTNARYDGETCFSLGLTPAYLPGREERPWLVEYVAGYRVTGSTVTCMGVSSGDDAFTTGITLPDDIVQAVAVRAAELYSNPMGVSSRRVGDLAVQYATAGPDGSGMSGAESLLAPYRRWA